MRIRKAKRAAATSPAPELGFLETASRRYLGYDLFISYSRRDGGPYAEALVSKLSRFGYSCFLDRRAVTYQEPLTAALESALRRSRALVVVGTRKAVDSPWMAFEIRSFLQRTSKRSILIPLDVDGIREQSPWLGMSNRIWLEEVAGSTEPSEEILYQIRRSLLFRRRTAVWQNLLAVIALVLLLISGLALWQWRTAEDRYRTAPFPANSQPSRLSI